MAVCSGGGDVSGSIPQGIWWQDFPRKHNSSSREAQASSGATPRFERDLVTYLEALRRTMPGHVDKIIGAVRRHDFSGARVGPRSRHEPPLAPDRHVMIFLRK